MAVPWRFLPCPGCCSGCDGGCVGGTVPDRIQITLHGFADGTCSCSSLNGTYILDRQDGGSGPCVFTYTFPEKICGRIDTLVACICNFQAELAVNLVYEDLVLWIAGRSFTPRICGDAGEARDCSQIDEASLPCLGVNWLWSLFINCPVPTGATADWLSLPNS